MAKNWYARMYETGELTPASCYQPFTINDSISLEAIRLTVVVYNNPTLLGLRAHIYSNRYDVPAGLIMSSENTWDKSEICTLDNGAKQIYFTFEPKHLNGSDTYHLVLTADSYTGTDSSHIAWVLSYPKPIYTANVTANQTRYLGEWPQEMIIIGARL